MTHLRAAGRRNAPSGCRVPDAADKERQRQDTSIIDNCSCLFIPSIVLLALLASCSPCCSFPFLALQIASLKVFFSCSCLNGTET